MAEMNFVRMFFLSSSFVFLFVFPSIANSQSTSDYKKVCQGTSLGLTHQKWTEERYTSLYNRYVNCTHVDGNLELVFITDPNPDLNFLSGIKEVTGYVLIAISYVDFIPLTSLRVIRGRTLYHDNEEGLSNFYSLYVYLNFNPEDPLNVGLRELQLNSLHEIQSGSVFVQHNNRLCHGNDILWRDIVTGESSLIKTSEQHDPSHPHVQCESCHQSCDFNGTKFCWGQGPENCQKLNRETCSKQCGGQCFGSLPNQCCDSECIGGCVGPREDQCWACKNFDDNGVCQKFCPPEFVYDSALFKQVPNPNFKYSYGTLCVDKCPDHLNSRQGACVQECGKGMIANEDRKCVECNGTCPKECKFEFPLVNSRNVQTLKDCTIVHGSIFIPDLTFQRDDYLNASAMNVSDLSYLKDIREVSGFIKIQANIPQLTNLSFLSNLEIIHGMKLDSIASSLHVYKTNLDILGLNSLKEIRNGAIFVSNNDRLCHAKSISWDKIIKQTKQKTVIQYNKPNCEQEGKICHSECSSDGCWGPSDDQCFSCKNFKFVDENNRAIVKCVSSCSRSGMFESAPKECRPCHEECSTNCFGPNSDQCDSCKKAKDGPYCVSNCPQAKYLDEEGVCRECHANCDEDGCTGPQHYQSARGCKSCKLPLFKWRDAGTSPPNTTTCLNPGSKCPSGHFRRMFKTACMGCHPLCRECVGPTLEECSSCKWFRLESKCTFSCPSNYYQSMQLTTSFASDPSQNTSLSDKKKVLFEATCLPCHHNCLKCNGPSNRNCSICKQYKVFLNESSVDPRDFYCAEKCPEDKPESVVINMETICQPLDYAARGRMIASISLVVSISIVISTIVVLIFCLKKQKAQNTIREAKEVMSQANTKEEVSLLNDPSKIPDMSNLIIIKSSELTIGSSIGNGAYGEVHKGVWRPKGASPIEVAIKILKENSQEILDEARIMASVNHECCIKILCVSLSAELMLITPLMKLGCMLDYVRKNLSSITNHQILLWSKQIAMGMDHLESRGIVHCDLAARNVLVDSVKQVKITDFGLARLHLWKELQSMSSENEVPNKMPVKWLAPESLKEKAFTHKSDVWSYGITIWELCTFGDRPYKFITNFCDVFKYLKDGKRLEKPEICSPEFHEQLKKCWFWEPEMRPTFSELATSMDYMLDVPLKFINIKPEHRRPTFTNQSIRSDRPHHPDNHNNNHYNHHHENNCLKPTDYLEPPILYKNLLQVKAQSPPSYANISFKKDHRDSRESSEFNELTYIPSVSDLSHSYKNDFTPGFLDRPTRLESVRSPDLPKYKSYAPYANSSPVHKKYLDQSKPGGFSPVKDKHYEHEYYNALDFST